MRAKAVDGAVGGWFVVVVCVTTTYTPYCDSLPESAVTSIGRTKCSRLTDRPMQKRGFSRDCRAEPVQNAISGVLEQLVIALK